MPLFTVDKQYVNRDGIEVLFHFCVTQSACMNMVQLKLTRLF